MPGLRYRLRIPEPRTHLLHVELEAEGVDGPATLRMPSWAPGSYLMREFPRNVQWLEAEDGAGNALRWTKTDKNTWEVDAPADGRLRVRYAVYAAEPTVRTSHVDATHAAVLGSSVFVWMAGREGWEHRLEVEAPEGWVVDTALPEEDGAWIASSYDELVDSPLEIGTHARLAWEVEGVPHRWAIWGRGNWEEGALLRDTTRIVRAESAMFGGLPYDRYLFVLHLLPDAYGGLEHRDSTSLIVDRWSFTGRPYETFLGLTAHELFHAWNGKRIRPAVLGPFDYTREAYTRDLWVVEGFTTYYTDLLLRRAGLISRERYLERLGEAIGRHESLPGRARQTLSDSSFDTWIRFYRPDPSTPNSQVSYYRKGALVSLLLDMLLRERTDGRRSLDDVLRLLWERWGARDVGFPEGEAERIASELAGEDLTGWFDRHLRGTDELDFDAALAVAGLRRVEEDADESSASGTKGGAKTVAPDVAEIERRTGMRVKREHGAIVVAHVLAETAAWEAGVNAGDEIVAVDGLRAQWETLAARIGEAEGGAVPLALFRRDELRTVEVGVGPAAPKLRLVPVDEPTEAQRAALDDWLRTDVPDEEEGSKVG